MQRNPKLGFKSILPDLDSLIFAIFVDAGFAKNADFSSQLGFMMTLMEKHHNVNSVHYGSIKSERITRSIFFAQLFQNIHGFDIYSTICLATNDILGRVVQLHIFTDSRSLFDCLTKLLRTAEKQLLINLSTLSHSYERRKITQVFWMLTEHNAANGSTKQRPPAALKTML